MRAKTHQNALKVIPDWLRIGYGLVTGFFPNGRPPAIGDGADMVVEDPVEDPAIEEQAIEGSRNHSPPVTCPSGAPDATCALLGGLAAGWRVAVAD